MIQDEGCRISIKKFGDVIAYVICSTIDFDHLNQFKWNLDNSGYVVCVINTKAVKMHRYVKMVLEKCEIPPNYVVDHMEGNKLDNRRLMLRICTAKENARNKRKLPNMTSKYRGVSYAKKLKKYRATVTIFNRPIHIGSALTEEEAAKFYDAYLLQNVPDIDKSGFNLNFPNLKDELQYFKIPTIQTRANAYRYVYKYYNKFKTQIIHGEFIFRTYGDEITCAKNADKYIVDNKLDKKLNFPEDYPNYIPNKIVKTTYIDIDNNPDAIKLTISTSVPKHILLDKNLYDTVKFFKFHLDKNGYAIFKNDGCNCKLHRYLLNETDPSIVIDHINGDVLDNRLCNLRKITAVQNSQNKKKSKTASSAFYGVMKFKNRNYYGSTIQFGGKHVFFKGYKHEHHAARARDLYILTHLPNSMYKMNYVWNTETIDVWTRFFECFAHSGLVTAQLQFPEL